MSRSLKLLIFVFAVVFLLTGVMLLLINNADDASPLWLTLLARNHGLVFVWHLCCWMVTGMLANYYWDLVNQGKTAASMQVERIVLPLLVSPIVFYPTYMLWLSSSSQSYILFEVIAFQNGFFWQALFAKARPAADTSSGIPWTVKSGNGSLLSSTNPNPSTNTGVAPPIISH
jgi:hypothetical protein